MPPVRAVLLALSLLAPAAAADAQVRSGWSGPEEGQVRLLAASTGVGADGTLSLGIEFALQDGWITYWRDPGEAGIPPEFDWTGSANLADVSVAWPAPLRKAFDGLDSYVYGDGTILPVSARVPTAGRGVAVRLLVRYGVCREICIPAVARVSLDLPAAPAAATVDAARIAAARDRVPHDGAGDGFRLAGAGVSGGTDLLLEVTAEPPFAAPEVFLEAPSPWRFGRPAIRLYEGGARALVRVPVMAETLPPAGTPLTATVADGDRAAAFSFGAPGG